jgi:beta-aspartyl-peptidase (threonine type)
LILVAGDLRNSGTALAWQLLREKQSALVAIEQGIRAVEANDADWSVGRGGYPNALGTVELDAAVMDGRSRASGAVGALSGFLHPVSVAYAVMAKLPHVLLVGEGAARFAAEIGAERSDLLTEAMRENLVRWKRHSGLDDGSGNLIEAVKRGMDPQQKDSTTVYLAQDAVGDIAVATSTSGWAWKYPGRLGDTPIAGAGFYADNRYGAAACMGKGELAIRTGLARMTVTLMQMGRSVQEAVQEALMDVLSLPDVENSDLQLQAIDTQGNHDVAYLGPVLEDTWHFYYTARGDDATTVRQFARHVGDKFDIQYI